MLSVNSSAPALQLYLCIAVTKQELHSILPAVFLLFLHLTAFLLCRIGLDLINGKPRDNKQAGVFEPTMVKTKSLKFATEAAITILRIDDLIKLHPETKEERGGCYEDAVQSGALEE